MYAVVFGVAFLVICMLILFVFCMENAEDDKYVHLLLKIKLLVRVEPKNCIIYCSSVDEIVVTNFLTCTASGTTIDLTEKFERTVSAHSYERGF